tara:strand:- start:7048 stop:8463 length:1416 start_codon:yes stop_codon:yes gene_type:complete
MQKNISKPTFGTDGWRAKIDEEFNLDNCILVIKSFLKTLDNKNKKIIIGYDTRFLSKDFSEQISKYIYYHGHKVLLSVGPVPTPVVSFAVKNKGFDFGIIITASHNSSIWNGIKIKNSEGESINEKIVVNISEKINSLSIENDDYNYKNDEIKIKREDFIEEYLNSISKFINIEKIKKSKLKVIVDCMFGTSVSLINKILEGGECNIIEINNDQNPNFPGIIQPEPIAENLKKLISTVVELNADIGFGFDADSDRVGLIDNKGNYIDAPYTFCSIADHVLGNRKEVRSICTTVSMSSMIDKIATSYGVECFRTKIGFKYVAPEMTLNKSILGGEESGGYSYSPHLNERDGTVSALLLLEQLVDSKFDSSELYINQKKKYGDYFFKRQDLKIDQNSKNKLIKYIEGFNNNNLFNLNVNSIEKKDGLKIILGEDSWILLRLSGTEPVARIYCESKNEKSVNDLISKFASQIRI